jgi:hypothetical protein
LVWKLHNKGEIDIEDDLDIEDHIPKADVIFIRHPQSQFPSADYTRLKFILNFFFIVLRNSNEHYGFWSDRSYCTQCLRSWGPTRCFRSRCWISFLDSNCCLTTVHRVFSPILSHSYGNKNLIQYNNLII